MTARQALEDVLRKIYVEPTTRCNLNCLTCVRNVWQEPPGTMEWPVFETLIRGLKDFPEAQTMAFSGTGEPLLHPRIADMVRMAHERGLRTEVTSNGLLLTRELVVALLDAGHLFVAEPVGHLLLGQFIDNLGVQLLIIDRRTVVDVFACRNSDADEAAASR